VAEGGVKNDARWILWACPEGRPLRLIELEREHIRQCLIMCAGNMSHTARALGIDRRTLYRKLDSELRGLCDSVRRVRFDDDDASVADVCADDTYDPPTFENP